MTPIAEPGVVEVSEGPGVKEAEEVTTREEERREKASGTP